MTPPVEPPLRCAVLVEGDAAGAIDWILEHANGDLADARARAAEWAAANPGRIATVLLYEDHCVAAVATNWAKGS